MLGTLAFEDGGGGVGRRQSLKGVARLRLKIDRLRQCLTPLIDETSPDAMRSADHDGVV